MLKLFNFDDSVLSQLLVTAETGQYLFRQGDRALTFFVITEGEIELYQRTGSVERLVETVGPGKIMGEKALVSEVPFRHNLSAKVKQTATLLEFDAPRFKAIEAKIPAFGQHVLRTVIERLERANNLIGVLQLKCPSDRLTHYLHFLCKYSTHRDATGVEIKFSLEQLMEILHLDSEFLHDSYNALISAGIITPRRDSCLVTDENALLGFAAHLQERFAA